MVSTVSFAAVVASVVSFLHAAHVAPLMSDDEMFALDFESLEGAYIAYIAVKAGASKSVATALAAKDGAMDFNSFATYADQKLSERRSVEKAPAATGELVDQKINDEMHALLKESSEVSTQTHIWLMSGGAMLLAVFIVFVRFSGKKVATA